MKIKYDEETIIQLTDRFRAALIELMQAEKEMLTGHPDFNSKNWYWGRCTIEDIAITNGYHFQFGAKEDMPDDNLGKFGIIVEDNN